MKDDTLLAVEPGAEDHEVLALVKRIRHWALTEEDKARILERNFSDDDMRLVLVELFARCEAVDFLAKVGTPGPVALQLAEENKELRRENAGLLREVEYDELTGLPNRASFNRCLFENYQLCFEQGGTISVLYIDLDGFKKVNDTLGHSAGDKLLQAVAGRLRSGIKLNEYDIVARLMTGDEFGIIVRNISRPAAAKNLARRLHEKLCLPYDIEGKRVTVGASIGIAYARPSSPVPLSDDKKFDVETWREAMKAWCSSLLDTADRAMLAVKEVGGGCLLSGEDPPPLKRKPARRR